MSSLRTSLLSREVIPFYLSLAALGGATLALDAVLHLADMVWIGRYLGIPGVLLILASSGYSMRKRKLIKRGKPASLLRWHERLAWKPATFDHTRYFVLTGPHKASCTTCHTGGNTSRSTCFGCHEHQPDQIRASHAEEGIRNIENCVRCHRSASGEGGERREGGDDD